MPAKLPLNDRTRLQHATIEAAFYLALAMLLTHELDAVANHEWRVIPLLRLLPDDQGMIVFVASHILLFAGVIAAIASQNHKVRYFSRLVICTFLIIHAGLHYGFSSDPAYEFDAILSVILIYGGAAISTLYLLLDRVVFRLFGAAATQDKTS